MVEVVATLGTQTETEKQCTPNLPSVAQGDLGVSQAPGSLAVRSNATGLASVPIRGFSRGYDEISSLVFSETGTDTGIFFTSEFYEGSIPSSGAPLGPITMLSATSGSCSTIR